MSNATKSADMQHSLRMIQSMVRDSIQQVSGLDDHLKDSTEQLKQILGLHKLIDVETKKGKGLIKTLGSRAFWDKHLYKLVFIIYLVVVFYIVSKHFGNLFYRIYDWTCWTLSWFIFWFPGFNWICPPYSTNEILDNVNQDEIYNQQFDKLTSDEMLNKPEL